MHDHTTTKGERMNDAAVMEDEVGDEGTTENPNNNCLEGMACPKCGSFGPFLIEVQKVVVMHDDGWFETADTDQELWGDVAICADHECEHVGTVEEFRGQPTKENPTS